jgi:capsular polysaccharide transport system permease protein
MYLIDHFLIVRALILLNLRSKHFANQAGILMEFLRPTVVCILHYVLFLVLNKTFPPGIKMEQVVWAAFTIWFTVSQIYMALLPHRRTAHTLRFPGVSAMHMRLALCAWPVILYATFCYGSVFVMIIFGDNIAVPNVPLTAFIMLLSAMLGFGWGLLGEGICRAVPALDPVFHVLPWLVFISCGIYFSIATTPQILASIFVYNPVLHLVEYERYAFEPGYPVTLVNLWYPAACAAGLLLVGLALNRRLRYKVAA